MNHLVSYRVAIAAAFLAALVGVSARGVQAEEPGPGKGPGPRAYKNRRIQPDVELEERRAADKAAKARIMAKRDALEAAAEARADVKEAREEARKAMQEAREAVKEAQEEARETVKEARRAQLEEVHEAREEVRQAREEVREAMREALPEVRAVASRAHQEVARALRQAAETQREALRAAAEARKEAFVEAARAHREAVKALREAGADIREARGVLRRTARINAWKALRVRLGERRSVPANMRAELRTHARRMARLDRIGSLATEKDDDKTAGKVEKLRTKEVERHQRLMDRLTAMLTEGKETETPTAAVEKGEEGKDEAEPEAAGGVK